MQNIGTALAPESEQIPYPIDDHFQILGNLLDIADSKVFERDPQLIFDAFLILQEHHELVA